MGTQQWLAYTEKASGKAGLLRGKSRCPFSGNEEGLMEGFQGLGKSPELNRTLLSAMVLGLSREPC